MENEDLYTDEILDHSKNPKNFGILDNANVFIRNVNPFCGDQIELYLNIEDDIIKDIKFIGKSCAISKASASMLFDSIIGKSVEEVKNLDQKYVLDTLGLPNLNMIRLKCALLPLVTIQKAIQENSNQK